tara:strand:- start:7752 stop:8810 length:1059 start_codon:yes stop_codon:yes gene_type:complete
MFKKIAKFVKRGLKKVGKFFKRAFKKVGKFVGKLGPVGMLGMMLIMPQLGAWWSDFGAWAKELTGPFGGLMKGIHGAGEFVGTAASSVTEGISSLIKSIPGVGDAYQGFETWAQEQMNSARDFLGLETTKPIPTKEVTIGSEDFKYTTGDKTLREQMGDVARQQGVPEELIDVPGASERSLMSPQQDVTLQKISTQTTDSQLFGGRGTPSFESLDDVKGFITQAETSGYSFSPEEMSVLESETVRLGGASTATTGTKWYDKAKNIYGGIEATRGVLGELGIGVEDYEPYYQAYVADNYVPMYESAQVDWTQQGYAGTPTYGMGNQNYLQSIYASFQTDPYYQWMAEQQTRRV